MAGTSNLISLESQHFMDCNLQWRHLSGNTSSTLVNCKLPAPQPLYPIGHDSLVYIFKPKLFPQTKKEHIFRQAICKILRGIVRRNKKKKKCQFSRDFSIDGNGSFDVSFGHAFGSVKNNSFQLNYGNSISRKRLTGQTNILGM